jgi:hypothetical protein
MNCTTLSSNLPIKTWAPSFRVMSRPHATCIQEMIRNMSSMHYRLGIRRAFADTKCQALCKLAKRSRFQSRTIDRATVNQRSHLGREGSLGCLSDWSGWTPQLPLSFEKRNRSRNVAQKLLHWPDSFATFRLGWDWTTCWCLTSREDVFQKIFVLESCPPT